MRVLFPCGAFPWRLWAVLAVSGFFAYYACAHECPRGFDWLSSIVFSIKLTLQCDGCLIWGLGWQAGLVTGLREGQAYGVFHRPGFGFVTPQNVIIAAKCSSNAKSNNIDAKYNNITNAKCNNFPTQNVITFLKHAKCNNANCSNS